MKKILNFLFIISVATVIAFPSAFIFAQSSSDQNNPGENTDQMKEANRGISDPDIEQIVDIRSSSVVLPIRLQEFSGRNVNVTVMAKTADNRQIIRNFNVRLDANGRGSILFMGLKSDTDYSFTVNVRDMNEMEGRLSVFERTVRTTR